MRFPPRNYQVARNRVRHNLRIGRLLLVSLVSVGVELLHQRLQPRHLGSIANLDQLDRTLLLLPWLIQNHQHRLHPLGQVVRRIHEQRTPVWRGRQDQLAGRLRRRHLNAEHLAQHCHRLGSLDVRQRQRFALTRRTICAHHLDLFHQLFDFLNMVRLGHNNQTAIAGIGQEGGIRRVTGQPFVPTLINLFHHGTDNIHLIGAGQAEGFRNLLDCLYWSIQLRRHSPYLDNLLRRAHDHDLLAVRTIQDGCRDAGQPGDLGLVGTTQDGHQFRCIAVLQLDHCHFPTG